MMVHIDGYEWTGIEIQDLYDLSLNQFDRNGIYTATTPG